ncbi:MAG: MgtC/SapB family protein [Planctomycetota bacterium]|jgi:putative Mg2+ transporter-C (MgtC) family protein
MNFPVEPLDYALTAVMKLLLAAALGALIGVEREHHGRSAGFRTQLLVALGSALAMVVSLYFGDMFGMGDKGPAVQVDPARVAYGIMAGVGFLGAGAMIRYGVGIRGMTTAASLWCTAAVGLAAGLGMPIVAAATTAIVLFALSALTYLERFIPSRQYKKITVKIAADGRDNVERVRTILKAQDVRVVSVDYNRDFSEDTETITFHVSLLPRRKSENILNISNQIDGLRRLTVN